MRDAMTPTKIESDTSVIKIKGHTKIELRDINTGEVEVYEHDNVVTDGLQDICKNRGMYWSTEIRRLSSALNNSTISYNRIWAQELSGGILLFRDPIPTTAKYMPPTNQMTANSAWLVSNTANPPELGSYNPLESSFTDDEITFVYDWNTAQGNGTISCVCLCDKYAGTTGYGNASNTRTAFSTSDTDFMYECKRSLFYSANNYEKYMNFPRKTNDSDYYHTLDSLYFDMTNDVVYVSEWKSKFFNTQSSDWILPINIYGNSISSKYVDIFRRGYLPNLDSAPLKKQFEITLPASESYNRFWTCKGNAYYVNNIIVGRYFKTAAQSYTSDYPVGSTIQMWMINPVTEVITPITIVNNLPGVISFSDTIMPFCFIDDTYMLVYCNDGKTYKINWHTSEVIGVLTYNGGNFNVSRICNDTSNTAGSFPRPVYITDSLMRFDRAYVYNVVTGVIEPINGELAVNAGNWSYPVFFVPENDGLMCVSWYYSDNLLRLSFMSNILRLLTINNLPTPITKTSSKTMKVTYTLTRATT